MRRRAFGADPAPAAVLLAAAVYAAFNAYFWDRAWDDMAITLGFARTFATTGAFAPTPLSDPVEGTSSLLWMLINAAVYALHGAPAMLYTQAKLLGNALLLADVGLAYMVAVACGVTRSSAFLVSLAFAGSAAAINESVNGMENPLLVFAYCLAFLLYFKPQTRMVFALFLVFSSAVIFIRWEGLWFLLPFALIAWWRSGLRGLFGAPVLVWLGLFAGQTLWRFLAFGDVLPNTIRAKTHSPYLAEPPDGIYEFLTARFWDMLREIAQVKPFVYLAVLCIALLAAAWFLRRRTAPATVRQRISAIPRPIRLAAAIVVTGGVFAAVTGRNWGHDGRMFFAALPFLLVTVAWAWERVAAAARIPARPVALVVALAVVGTVAIGVQKAHRRLAGNIVTVAQMARILPPLETVKRLTGAAALSVAHPDLGALVMLGDGYHIVDTALLCNRRLARTGYGAFKDEIFMRERPDVIQTHGVWTEISGIAAMDRLYSDYVPVFLHGVRLFIRRDIFARIPAPNLRRQRFSDAGETDAYDPDLIWTRHSRSADFAINRRFEYYWTPVAADARRPAG